MGSDFFPHRGSTLERLERIARAGRLGQPLLVVGPDGSGKETTALEFARRLNCVGGDACRPESPCESCAKAVSFQHPDIRWIGPASASFDEGDMQELLLAKRENPFFRPLGAATAQVGIGDAENPGPMTARSLIQFLQRRAFQGRAKVAIVAEAQRLNTAAANALLKTLEEPPPGAVIMLLTTGTEGMLPTILSRCQEIRMNPWPPAELTALLQGMTGAPAAEVAAAAAAADGNARRALALLQDIAPITRGVALALGEWIHQGRRGSAAILADELHRGAPPHILDAEEAKVWKAHTKGRGSAAEADGPAAGAPALRRSLAIQLCEWLVLLYSEIMKCRELGEDWIPRLPRARQFVAAAAARRLTGSLLADIARIETACAEIDRNLNIGLVMAVLGEGLIDHAQEDQAAIAAAEA